MLLTPKATSAVVSTVSPHTSAPFSPRVTDASSANVSAAVTVTDPLEITTLSPADGTTAESHFPGVA